MYGGTLEENKELALEDIALQIDGIDSSIHVEALKEFLPQMKGKLKQAYFEIGGDDVWGE